MTNAGIVSDLASRTREVRERVEAAARRAGREPSGVALVAVSKTWPAETVVEAVTTGLDQFGENRVQEGLAKAASVAESLPQGVPAPTWHLIGHLQTNKVRAALESFAILHSVDSERLLRAISGSARAPVSLMIEVNVAAEPTKNGIDADELPSLLAIARELPWIDVRGLMTVAPQVTEAELARPVFRELRRLAEAHHLEELSMGMTNDYEVAIEEGATFVRVGRALFGDRR